MILKRKKITVIINALNLRESMRRNLGFQPSQPPPLTKKKGNRSKYICPPLCIYVCTYINDSWAVWAYEASSALAQKLMFDFNHVLLGDALSDAHHQRYLCVNGLNDGCCREWRRYINHRGVCPCALLCLKQRIKGIGIASKKKKKKGHSQVMKQCHLMLRYKNPSAKDHSRKNTNYIF